MILPARIQLRRMRGWRLPAGAVVVARPTMWGNPFDWREALSEWGGSADAARAAVVQIYRDWLEMTDPPRFTPTLRSRLEGPCHRDVLLDLANREAAQ